MLEQAPTTPQDREPTALEVVETAQRQEFVEATDPDKATDALTDLGIVHLQMGRGHRVEGAREVLTGMRVRTTAENIGTAARVAARLTNVRDNPFVAEHRKVAKQDRATATQQRAGER